MKTVYFDDTLRTRSGKRIPYYDSTSVSDDNAHDGALVWFHIRYGLMHLYRLHQVDSHNFIAEDLHVVCSTSSEKWRTWGNNPSLALA
jgi:hypothetical protein